MDITHDAKVKDVFFQRSGRNRPEEGSRLSDNSTPFEVGKWVTSKFGSKGTVAGKVVEVCPVTGSIAVAWSQFNVYDHAPKGVEDFDLRKAQSWLLPIHVTERRHSIGSHPANLGNNITAVLLAAVEHRWHPIGHTARAPFDLDSEGKLGASDGHVTFLPTHRGQDDHLTRIDVWHDYTGRVTVARVMGERYVGSPYAVVIDSGDSGGDAGHAAMMWFI